MRIFLYGFAFFIWGLLVAAYRIHWGYCVVAGFVMGIVSSWLEHEIETG